jgi:hypothetical protein
MDEQIAEPGNGIGLAAIRIGAKRQARKDSKRAG